MTRRRGALGHWRTMGIALFAALLVAFGIVIGLWEDSGYRLRRTQEASAQAHVLAETATAALSFDDTSALSQYVAALRSNPEIAAVAVYDANGRLAAGYGPTRLAAIQPKKPAGLAPGVAVAVAEPVMLDGQKLGEVYLGMRLDPLSRRIARYSPAFLVLIMAVASLLLLADYARRLRRANLGLLDEMTQKERAQEALRQTQKMEAVGRLTGGIAHDFNNMLAIVIGSLDIILSRYAEKDARLERLARTAFEGAQRGAALTRRLLAFSRLQPLDPKPVDVARSVGEMSDLLRRTLGETIKMETVNAAGLWLAHIDRGELETAIVNLAINARDAMPEGGKLTIETANVYLDLAYVEANPDAAAGQYVMVALTDTGSGMTSEILAQVFEPFFTTKGPSAGTGLGLSQVHGFIKQSGGHVALYSEPGLGTSAKLYLPRSHHAAAPERPLASVSARGSASALRGLAVLVAEDEAGVREFTREALEGLGCRPILADGGEEAIAVLAARDDVALLLTDVVMPGLNGRTLAERARHLRPQIAVLYMTGYTRNAIVHNGVLDPDAQLISKPFTLAELAARLDAALARSARSATAASDAEAEA